MQHFRLLSQIRRLNPKILILDSVLSTEARPGIFLQFEDSDRDGSSIRTAPGKREALVGLPSVPGLGMMLENLGFIGEFLDWEHLDLPDWDGVEDYRDGKRFTVLIRPV
jgi:hypothetical protein